MDNNKAKEFDDKLKALLGEYNVGLEPYMNIRIVPLEDKPEEKEEEKTEEAE